MWNNLNIFLQKIAPQHWLNYIAGKLADSNDKKLKNYLIEYFMKRYDVNLSEALIENPKAYSSFNDFFTRKLKPNARPIASGAENIVSPADGTITEIGQIRQNQLLQAKNNYYDLESLLAGNQELTQSFYDGQYATFYLAPHNYHRVHMPYAGKLLKTIYVPGNLFSVNTMTADLIPQLFTRNERLITIFATEAGLMSVIMVGAMIVGNIKTDWSTEPLRDKFTLTEKVHSGIELAKGSELGYFCLGSTVIVLFQKNKIKWLPNLTPTQTIQVGQVIAHYQKQEHL